MEVTVAAAAAAAAEAAAAVAAAAAAAAVEAAAAEASAAEAALKQPPLCARKIRDTKCNSAMHARWPHVARTRRHAHIAVITPLL